MTVVTKETAKKRYSKKVARVQFELNLAESELAKSQFPLSKDMNKKAKELFVEYLQQNKKTSV